MIQSIGNQTQQLTKMAPFEEKSVRSPGEAQANFADTLKKAIANVNESQVASDKKTEALVNGNVDDLHNVMITAQKSSITLEATVQIQKKVVDAYKEIMSMQV
ncbi:flagellar hook-basal body complex protein FliE [Virgibacillus proomii]|uniref:flagellar hook-basal body complex protein FliE n=1 Tax=Virgibacillus proomii TaxID=84407 RepID=UPI001C108120|nr:flagellar hook-basal body complex protein FliE [Virgibacillus proomii]MBU5267803.1 flagellar hook-basal body complex protein FliE [Virgibacillus proomii]